MYIISGFNRLYRSRWYLPQTAKILITSFNKTPLPNYKQYLVSGIFPTKLKIAKVLPSFKTDDVTLMDNYRPIALLTSISKLFEKVVFDQLYDYFQNNHLFYSSQYGFIESLRYPKSSNFTEETKSLWNSRQCTSMVLKLSYRKTTIRRIRRSFIKSVAPANRSPTRVYLGPSSISYIYEWYS